MKEDSIVAIIPAAGIGSRFDGDVPKQYFNVNGSSIIESAVLPFLNSIYVSKIIIPIAKNDKYINAQNFFNREKISFVEGGKDRHDSVLNALEVIDESYEYVITHDAARPNISEKDIEDLYKIIIEKGSSCVYFYSPVYDSIKQLSNNDKTLDKNDFLLVQTPQISKLVDLKNSIKSCLKEGLHIPDESFAIEHCGYSSSKILGRRSNIKVTEKYDIDYLNKFLTRGGIGFDLHKYKQGKGITLGGVKIECDFEIVAHSDGDVLLHSIADSILGAAGLGDIGEHFPDTNLANKGLDSKKIINFCLETIKNKNLEIYNIDNTIICETPKINPHRKAILNSLSNILKIDSEKIGLKATTSEQIGIIGKNKAIAVQSFVNLRKRV
jgi:2-C-methyl-D-erythritol 4-phosphate cytidylyltransferase/2-C-methyl-D-erythritol 2,4-cyclodiphosphate synthase